MSTNGLSGLGLCKQPSFARRAWTRDTKQWIDKNCSLGPLSRASRIQNPLWALRFRSPGFRDFLPSVFVQGFRVYRALGLFLSLRRLGFFPFSGVLARFPSAAIRTLCLVMAVKLRTLNAPRAPNPQNYLL